MIHGCSPGFVLSFNKDLPVNHNRPHAPCILCPKGFRVRSAECFSRPNLLRPHTFAAIGWLFAILFFIPPAMAADLWVDRDSLGGQCSDARSRAQVTKSTPWCTLIPPATLVQPGDTVHVRGGVYTERNTCPLCCSPSVLEVVVSGTAQNPIKFVAEPGERVALSPAGGAEMGIVVGQCTGVTPRFIEVSGFEVSGGFTDICVYVNRTSDVTLSDLDISGCVNAAFSTNYAGRITLENSSIHDNPIGGWTSAVNLWQCEDENVIRGNRIWANTDEHPDETEGHGIIMDSCFELGGALIENNVIWDNEGWCILIYQSDGATIRNNTCWQNSLGRNNGTGELSLRGNQLSAHNNILVSREGGPALLIFDYERDGDLSTVATGSNLMWSPNRQNVVIWPPWNVDTVAEFQQANPYGWGQNSIQVDPLLRAPASHSFDPTPPSPAIDAGSDADGADKDAIGVLRPVDGNGDGSAQTDLGAYEFTGIFEDSFEGGSTSAWTGTQP